jgi:hypothetical protein
MDLYRIIRLSRPLRVGYRGARRAGLLQEILPTLSDWDISLYATILLHSFNPNPATHSARAGSR